MWWVRWSSPAPSNAPTELAMTDIFIAILFGIITGYCARPRDKDYVEQQRIYDERVKELESKIQYYKELCKWHVEQKQNAKDTK